jgi:hypothetical protein
MKLGDTVLQNPSRAEESNDDFEWHRNFPSDKAGVNQFVGEKSWLDKTAARSITENSQPRVISSCRIFRPSWH